MLVRTSLFLDFVTSRVVTSRHSPANLVNDKDFSSQCPLLREAESEIDTLDEIKPKSAGRQTMADEVKASRI